MGLLAAHLNDAGIVVVDDQRILYREPGFALLEDSHLVTGDDAYRSARLKPRNIQNHYWSELHAEPLADRRFRHLSAADLVSRQLEQMWRRVSGHGSRLAMAVPPTMSKASLGLLLGIAAELGIPIVAMVDAAVAATRRRYEHAVPVHVDIGLHSSTLSRLQQDRQVQADRSVVVDDAGMLALQDSWLRLIAEAFVQQSRFDPLHTAETEQALQNQLPDWLARASTSSAVTMHVEYRGSRHEAGIESLQFVSAAGSVYQKLVSQLRALVRAEDTPALQLTDRASRLPGLADTLKTRVGGEVFHMEPGATARGLLARCREDTAKDAVTLSRHLPWDRAPVTVDSGHDGSVGGMPTHLLLGHTAYSLRGQPLVLGSQETRDERWLELQQDIPGVSRRHCVLAADNRQIVVTDHSRYGTFLNGHRIDGSAVLQSGDVLRVGTPGVEMHLISAEEHHGS